MSDRPSDLLDQAEELSSREREEGVAVVRDQMRPQQTQNSDGTWPFPDCMECGDEIPPERLAAGRARCTLCQAAAERVTSQYQTRPTRS